MGAALPQPWILAAAQLLARSQPIGWCPGWRFGERGQAWYLPYKLREQIWLMAREHALSGALTIRWYDDLLLSIDLGSDLGRCLFVSGLFDPNEFMVLDRFLRPGMHFLDAGANLGLYSLFAAKRVAPHGCVTAFEPSPRDFQRLRQHLEVNRIRNVETHALALGDSRGEACLHISESTHEGQSTLGAFSYESVVGIGDHTVPLRRIDDLATTGAWPRIDFLKVDVEGSELSVLRGAQEVLRKDRPLILLELLEQALQRQGASSRSVLDFLDQSGYRVCHFHPLSGRVSPGCTLSDLNVLAVPHELRLDDELLHDRG